MATIRVINHLDDLARDAQQSAGVPMRELPRVVERNTNEGRDRAKSNARRTARRHGKHYPKSITSERLSLLSWEYGPDSAMPQGGMSFEHGSRNQPPHLDMAKSADIVGPKLAEDVADVGRGMFW